MSPMTLAPKPDKPRCAWPGADPLYLDYHDREWGVPETDSRALWELLMLEGFQAGLAWIIVLRKREAFRAAFDQFDPASIARYQESDIERLMQNPGIIRARAKIEATILGARLFLDMQRSATSFAAFAWTIAGGKPIQSTGPVPASTPLSETMSKELKLRGFKFVGPTIAYAWMQASGMVNDHSPGCFRREICARTKAKWK